MKSVFMLLLASLAFTCISTAAPAKDAKPTATAPVEAPLKLPTVCNQFLLGTFKLDMSPVPDNTPNLVCPGVTSNCCSYAAQHQINRLWAKGSERKTIVKVYRGFVDTYKSVFEQFARIETMAQTIFDATADQLNSPCNLLAKAVVDAKFSALKDEVVKSAKRAFDFLYTSRKGFYCSLCDKNAHSFYQTDGELIATSYGFCSNMVAETLPYFLFKHVHFMKMSRLHGELMAKCTIDGEYSANKYLNNIAIFVKDAQFIDELTRCKANLQKSDAYNGCEKFCKRFNPTRFDQLLEGDLSKLAGFGKLLKALTDSKIGIVKVSTKDALLNITENSKRILSERNLSEVSNKQSMRLLENMPSRALAETPKPPADKAEGDKATPDKAATDKPTGDKGAGANTAPESANKRAKSKIEINNFNAKFEGALVRPVTYDFSYDLSSLYKISFDYSYIQSSHNTRYNISEWRTEIMKNGINFYYYGRSADTTKATAYSVFLQANGDPAAKAKSDAAAGTAAGADGAAGKVTTDKGVASTTPDKKP